MSLGRIFFNLQLLFLAMRLSKKKRRALRFAAIDCFIFLLISGFYPFGTQHGDSLVVKGDDVATCFPVASNFPLFTSINHKQLCVSVRS